MNKVKQPEESKMESESTPVAQEQVPVVEQSPNAVPSNQEGIKFEENKKYVVRVLTAAGLPLVLRSEQNITLQEEIKHEIALLLEENDKMKETLLKSGMPADEEEEYLLRAANFHYITDNAQKAIAAYKQIIKENPAKMVALNNIGVVLDAQGEYDSALEYYNDALSKVSENIHLLSNKGIALYKSEKYEQALECFDAALKIDAGYISALTFKGHSLYRLGRNKDALDWYNKVIRLDNNNAEALYNKACLCAMKGDEYGGITSLEKAIRLDSTWKEAALQDKDLDSLRSNPRFRETLK